MALLFALIVLTQPGHCAVPVQAGIYVVIDPYNCSDLLNLQNAASAGCTSSTPNNPFCGPGGTQSISGVFIRVHWCQWQLANVTLGLAASNQSCYYLVNSAGGELVTTAINGANE